MIEGIKETNFHFPNQTGFYSGKVRDIYFFEDKLAMVATDRISAFDVILPRPIPYKGQVSNVLFQLTGGLRSGMGYTGSKDLATLKKNAKFVVQEKQYPI